MSRSSRGFSPASQRNRGPILDVLRTVLPERGTVLEIASGTGEHAVHFGAALPGLVWQPSDIDPAALASIQAWIDETGMVNVLPPLRLDVIDQQWPIGTVQAMFNANMLHISPPETAAGLMAGAGRHLQAGGVLVLYGPFRIGGAHTAPSNTAFDADLRARDPRWGVRDLETIVQLAADHGLDLEQRVPMPANNQTLVFRRRQATMPP